MDLVTKALSPDVSLDVSPAGNLQSELEHNGVCGSAFHTNPVQATDIMAGRTLVFDKDR